MHSPRVSRSSRVTKMSVSSTGSGASSGLSHALVALLLASTVCLAGASSPAKPEVSDLTSGSAVSTSSSSPSVPVMMITETGTVTETQSERPTTLAIDSEAKATTSTATATWSEPNATTSHLGVSPGSLSSSSTPEAAAEEFNGPQLPMYTRILATLACLVIFIVGISGNLLVPLVVIKTKYLRNSTNLFLINLSIADLLVLLVCMPTVFIELHSRPETWLLGEPMCKLSNFVEMLAANGSIFTILAISFERYYAICKPLKAGYKCTRLRATVIICVIWLLACVLTSPILIMAKSSQTIYIDGSLVFNCILETDTYWPKTYVIGSMFAFFCLPLLVLMLVYWLIGRRLIRENLALNAATGAPQAASATHPATPLVGHPQRTQQQQQQQQYELAATGGRRKATSLRSPRTPYRMARAPVKAMSIDQSPRGISLVVPDQVTPLARPLAPQAVAAKGPAGVLGNLWVRLKSALGALGLKSSSPEVASSMHTCKGPRRASFQVDPESASGDPTSITRVSPESAIESGGSLPSEGAMHNEPTSGTAARSNQASSSASSESGISDVSSLHDPELGAEPEVDPSDLLETPNSNNYLNHDHHLDQVPGCKSQVGLSPCASASSRSSLLRPIIRFSDNQDAGSQRKVARFGAPDGRKPAADSHGTPTSGEQSDLPLPVGAKCANYIRESNRLRRLSSFSVKFLVKRCGHAHQHSLNSTEAKAQAPGVDRANLTSARHLRSNSHAVVCSHYNGQASKISSELLVLRDSSKRQQMDSRRQVVVMLAFVVTCFFLLFFPYRVFTLWLILSTEDQVQSLGMEAYYNLTYFSRILIYLHSAINPIAYNLISTKFRSAFMSILLCRGNSSRNRLNNNNHHQAHQYDPTKYNYYKASLTNNHIHHHHNSISHPPGANKPSEASLISRFEPNSMSARHHHPRPSIYSQMIP